MGSDGVRAGYDIEQLAAVRALCRVPLIASGGAGPPAHFSRYLCRRMSTARWRRAFFTPGAIVIADLKE